MCEVFSVLSCLGDGLAEQFLESEGGADFVQVLLGLFVLAEHEGAAAKLNQGSVVCRGGSCV